MLPMKMKKNLCAITGLNQQAALVGLVAVVGLGSTGCFGTLRMGPSAQEGPPGLDGRGSYWEAEVGVQGYFGRDSGIDPLKDAPTGVEAAIGFEGTSAGKTGSGLGAFDTSTHVAHVTVTENLLRLRGNDGSQGAGMIVRAVAGANAGIGDGGVTRDDAPYAKVRDAFGGDLGAQLGVAFHQDGWPGAIWVGGGIAYNHFDFINNLDFVNHLGESDIDQVSPYLSLSVETMAGFDLEYAALRMLAGLR
jgi:hypothetical protein